MRLTTLLFIGAMTITGCFLPKKTAETKQTFSFDYIPKESNASGSANMTCALMQPYYATDFTAGSGELFRSFQSALGSDIEELIIAKGLTLKSKSFQSLDEMVFDDKKSTQMLIQIEIAPRFTAQQGGWKRNISLLGPGNDTYSYNGTASLVGKINVSGIEPLTNEKIWSKSVLIPNIENISISSAKYNRILTSAELLNDPSVYNAVGQALMRQYAGIMDKIAAHFSVEEFKTLKGQIIELKAKKGY